MIESWPGAYILVGAKECDPLFRLPPIEVVVLLELSDFDSQTGVYLGSSVRLLGSCCGSSYPKGTQVHKEHELTSLISIQMWTTCKIAEVHGELAGVRGKLTMQGIPHTAPDKYPRHVQGRCMTRSVKRHGSKDLRRNRSLGSPLWSLSSSWPHLVLHDRQMQWAEIRRCPSSQEPRPALQSTKTITFKAVAGVEYPGKN